MASTRVVSTAPVVEHVSIPREILAKLRRPEPKEPPKSVLSNGLVECATLNIEGMSRTVHFYLPRKEWLSHRKSGTIPLLIALHGSTEHGLLFRSSSTSYAYDQLACKEGFVMAYPDGYKGNWNDGRVNSTFPAAEENIDDVGFVRSIIAYSSRKYQTDADKTLMIGWSNGAQLILRMFYEANRPSIAAVGLHCCSLPEASNNKVNVFPSSNACIPVILVNGTADPVNPYEGGRIALWRLPNGALLGDRGLHIGSAKTAITLASNWGELHKEEVPGSSAYLKREDWIHEGEPVVRLVTMIGEGHHIPAPNQSDMPSFLGPTLRKVHAAQEVIDYFKIATDALS